MLFCHLPLTNFQHDVHNYVFLIYACHLRYSRWPINICEKNKVREEERKDRKTEEREKNGGREEAQGQKIPNTSDSATCFLQVVS